MSELAYLESLEQWISLKRSWIVEHGAEERAAGEPSAQPVRHVTAAGFLLAAGAIALVAAGIAFTAYAWSFLGALGQLLVLVLAGVLAKGVGYWSAKRIPGTAAALSVTGGLLLLVAGGFWLGADQVNHWVRALSVAGVSVMLVAWSYWQARRQPGAAVLTASVFAHLSFIALASGLVLDVDPVPSWTGWWIAGVCAVAAASFLALALTDAQRAWHRVPWPWFAAITAAAALTAAGVQVGTTLDDRGQSSSVILAASLVTVLVLAGIPLLVDRLTRARWYAPPVVITAVLLIVSFVCLTGVNQQDNRKGLAVVGAVLSVALVATAAHLLARGRFGETPTAHPRFESVVGGGLFSLAAVALGGAIAAALLPWTSPPLPPEGFGGFDSGLTFVAYDTWVSQSYPWTRGLALGGAAVAAAVIIAAVLRRLRPERRSVAPALVGLGAVAVWSMGQSTDVHQYPTDSTVVQASAMAMLLTAGLGLLAVVAIFALPRWTGWAAAAVAAVGASVAWDWLDLTDWRIAPEIHGALVAIPLILAGALEVIRDQRDRHETVRTWTTIGPALVALLLFPVAAVVRDTMDRAQTSGGGPDTEAIVRIVALLIIGTVLATAGGRNKWSAVFWPGIATIVIVAGAQVLDVASAVPQWISLTIVGIVLLVAGARWESVLRGGHRTRQWAGSLH